FLFILITHSPPISTLFPYTTLFRSYYGFTAVIEDFNGDGWPDIVVLNDSSPNYFYANRGNGTFEEIGATVGIAYNGEGSEQANIDRKSTRLNSSHLVISYAVFCLKK